MSEDRPGDITNNTARDVYGTMLAARDVNFETAYFAASSPEEKEEWSGPFAPPLMVDRTDPIGEAEQYIEEGRGRATLLTVRAEPGGGASAFGLEVLKRHYDRPGTRFPGGYLFTDLSRQSDPMLAVSDLLCYLGVPDKDVPATHELRLRMLHRHPRWNKGVAIMIDAPQRPVDVVPLIATAPNSLTLVVGSGSFYPEMLTLGERASLEHVSWRHINLEGLLDEDAAEMFRKRTGLNPTGAAERTMVADFVAAAEGNPNRIAGFAHDVFVRGVMGSRRPLVEAHREFFASTTVLAAAPSDRAVAAGLTEEQQDVAARAALHPDADFGVDVVAALLGGDVDRTSLRADLDVLVKQQILRPVDRCPGRTEPRYRFSSRRRIQEFARRSKEHMETLRRALSHYYAIAYGAHRVLMPGRWLQVDLDGHSAFPDSARGARSFASKEEARQTLLVERQTLVRVIRGAVQAGEFLMAAELCEALWPFWFHSGFFSDLNDAQKPLLDEALNTHRLEPARRSRLYAQNSIAYRRDQNLDGARRAAEQALELAEDEHPLVRFTAHDVIGDVRADEGRDAEAAAHFAAAAGLAEGLGGSGRRALHIALRKEGLACLRLGRLSEAESLLNRAWSLLDADDHQNRARTHTALGLLRAWQGRVDEALVEYDSAIALHRGVLKDARRTADVYVARADAIQDTDPAAARVDLECALGLYEGAEAEHQAAQVRARLDPEG